MAAEGKAQGFARNKRIAVAVAADPAADFKDIRNADIGIGRLKVVFHLAVEFGQGFKKLIGKMDTPLLISSLTLSLWRRVSLVCHKPRSTVSISRRSRASASALVQRSRCGSSARMRRLKFKTVWRCTSVGCAVKTAVTDVLSNCRCTDLPSAFPALSLRTVSVRLPSAALWYGIFVDLAAAFVVHVFGDIQNLGEQPAGKRQIVGLPFVQLRQYFFNQCRAVVGSGQEFDRFDNQRRGFFVQEVEQGLFQNSASAAKAASFGLFRICSCMIFLSLP